MKDGKYFNVRVYALLVNAHRELLIAEEFHYDTFMRKLPGGGLQFGEGTRECIIRELREELNIEVTALRHFYTTDFFIQSVFNENHQVLAIYYQAEIPEDLTARYRNAVETPCQNGVETFRWVRMDSLTPGDFTFPADQSAYRLLLGSESFS